MLHFCLSKFKFRMIAIWALGLGLFYEPLYAWGEQGHDLVTRVAVRLVEAKVGEKDPDFARLLRQKQHMLAHLSNVPDIVWRNMGPEVSQQNGPTHYIDLEYILKGDLQRKQWTIPKTMNELIRYVEETCRVDPENCAPGDQIAQKLDKVGHAPFRAVQFYNQMLHHLSSLKVSQRKGKTAQKQQNEMVDQFLQSAGLLSHFIGDLANPHHTTKNYDGWLSGQGGLHSYFESRIVDVFDLSLSRKVYDQALQKKPFRHLNKNQISSTPLEKIWNLVLQSNQHLMELETLDRRYSLITKSDKIRPAIRKEPDLIASRFEFFIIERLAMAVDTLSELWIDAWNNSQKPDLKFYQSFHYAVQPEYILADYLVHELR